MTREAWLEAGAKRLASLLTAQGVKLPALRVTCGFPAIGATRKRNRRVGECWHPKNSKDKTTELSVSPVLDDPVEVLGVLLHEQIHAGVGCEHGHKGPFRKVAKACGLEGKMTATVPGKELAKQLKVIAAKLGKYPHAALDATRHAKKQGTRLIKAECSACGYTVRVTRKWLDVGLPVCPCGETLEE